MENKGGKNNPNIDKRILLAGILLLFITVITGVVAVSTSSKDWMLTSFISGIGFFLLATTYGGGSRPDDTDHDHNRNQNMHY